MNRFAYFALLISALAAPLATAQPAFVNPSFAMPNLGACPNDQFSPPGVGWTYGGFAGITTGGCQQQTAATTYDAPLPPSGTQAGFIQSGCCVGPLPGKVQPGALSQSVSGFQAGHSYTISFYAAGRPFNGGCNYGCTELDFSVLVGTTDVLDVKSPPTTTFQQYTTSPFTATGSVNISFTGTAPSGTDETSFIDLVSIQDLGASQTLYMPQIVDGDGWQTTIAVTNTTGTAATASLQFFQATDAAGDTQAWTPPLVQAISTQNMQLAPGATVFLQTPGTAANLTQGFAELIASPGVLGYAIFTLKLAGGVNQDATALGVAPASEVLVPFYNTSTGFATSIAVVNASNSAETISATLLLASGDIVGGSPLNIPANGHAAFELPTQFPQSAGQTGTLLLSCSSGTFSVIGLRSNPTRAFTSIPVYVVSAAPFSTASKGAGEVQ